MTNSLLIPCPHCQAEEAAKQITVKVAVEEFCYDRIENGSPQFKSNELIDYVRMRLARPHLHDGTIMRRLRELRCDYSIRVVSTAKSIYEIV